MTARGGLLVLLLATAAEADPGRELAEKACAQCHVFPEPGLLDRESWRIGVLPAMGVLLGVDDPGGAGGGREVPPIGGTAWKAIVDYYLGAAPQALPAADVGRLEASGESRWFRVEQVARDGAAAATSVAVDEAGQVIVVGDAAESGLVVYSEDLEVIERIALGGVPVQVRVESKRRYLVTLIGKEVGPGPGEEGQVVRVTEGGRVEILASGLARPVSAVAGDWNGDGGEDLVVCNFGFKTGGLDLLSGGRVDGGRGAARDVRGAHVALKLLPEPGALAFSAASGLALMAQGNERVVRVEKIGRLSGAEVTELLRFPPSYGVSSMAEADLDGDGDLDLVITVGDNGDDTPVFKPYHGVYLYGNDGDGGLEAKGFLPMHGAYGVAAADFDGDGDADLGVVAYFANYAGGEDGVTILENGGGWAFQRKTVPGVGARGRYAVIAAGDVDGDDDVDLVLGNFPGGPTGPSAVGQELMEAWLAGGRVVVLRNVTED